MKKSSTIALSLVLACSVFGAAATLSNLLKNTYGVGVDSGAVATEPQDASAQDASPQSASTQDTDAASTYEQQVAQVQAADEAAGAGTSYVAGEVLVVFRDGLSADEVDAQLQGVDAVTTKSVSQDSLDQVLPVATLQIADTVTVAQAQEALSQLSVVSSTQPDHIYHLSDETTTTPDVTDMAQSASSTLTAQSTAIDDTYASSQWQLGDVNCYSAWDTAKCDNAVTVAVIDTGCATGNADLANNVVGAYNSVSRTSGNSAVSDSVGHGTHVAGIIAAQSDNGTGVSGVSYNANVMPIKAASSDGYFYDSSLTQAYNHLLGTASSDVNGDGTTGTVAAEYNVRVVNMSLGGQGECSSSDALLALIDKAYAANILTVCAAGNEESYWYQGRYYTIEPPYDEYPGDYATCVSVIALNSGDTIASYSNYNSSGSTVKNISAPGTSILSTYSAASNSCGSASYNTNGSYYGYMSGTSMASPVVAGVAALVSAANENLTAAQVKAILYDTADDLGASGWDETYGYGKVDAATAVAGAVGSSSNASDGSSGSDDNGSSSSGDTTTTWTRLAGATALDTMAAITQTSTSDNAGGTVIVAPEDGYWDALTASGLAGLSGAPILMTDGSTLSAQTKSELQRIAPSKVIIVGGTSAVSTSVANAIKTATGVTPTRYSGNNAVGTANAIYTAGGGSWSETAIIATSDTFQDALSIAPYAYSSDSPIFLTDSGSDTLSSATIAAIKGGSFSKAIIVGGTAAVSSSVESQLSGAGISDVKRLAGADCYGTSESIAEYEISTLGLSADKVGVATGTGYYDALCGAALCGKNGAILVLASNGNHTAINGIITAKASEISQGYVFGGTEAVSTATYNLLVNATS